MLKIAFAGTPEFACPSLHALLASEHRVVAVYTQPDRPAGRGRKLAASPVKQLALQTNIPVLQPETLRNPAQVAELAALQVDVLVVVAYGLLLPSAILAVPRFGCINVHASLLPAWRGAAPVQRAIIAGDSNTGVTIMQMEKGLDTGPILSQVSCPISETDTSDTILTTLAQLGATALVETLHAVERQIVVAVAQEHSQATHAPKITKEEAQLNWQLPAATLQRQIRGFNPWPMAYTFLDGQRIRLASASVVPGGIIQPAYGTIVSVTNDGIDVVTGDQLLRLSEVQLPGGKMLPVREILHAKNAPFRVGQQFMMNSALGAGFEDRID